MKDLIADFDNAFEKIKTPGFMKKSGLGGEIPFFIFPYYIRFENTIDKEISNLIKRLRLEGIRVLEINLYDTALEILNEKGGVEKMFTLEQKKKKSFFLKALQSALNIHEVFMPQIRQKIDNTEHELLFITGVAPVYPFIRSDIILNNLQSIAGHKPCIIFYPGEYTGQSMSLFNVLKDDNYYRAFNLKNYNRI